jgi:hypothetical protein
MTMVETIQEYWARKQREHRAKKKSLVEAKQTEAM